jgi:fucose permease
MGWVADHYSTSFSYIIPMFCFVIVVFFGLKGYQVKSVS